MHNNLLVSLLGTILLLLLYTGACSPPPPQPAPTQTRIVTNAPAATAVPSSPRTTR